MGRKLLAVSQRGERRGRRVAGFSIVRVASFILGKWR
jgi:hypothetical protein